MRITMNRVPGLLSCLTVAVSLSAQDLDHGKWTSVLRRYVTAESRVNYEALRTGGTGDLDSYLAEIAKPWPAGMEADAVKAGLINSYNALTVRWIVANFPVASIWATPGPFRVARYRVDGKIESLDSIETRLRDMKDPRIHGALVCAARSCPPLRRTAYTAATLNSALDDNFRAWLAAPSRNLFLPEQRLARVSEIFQWYAADFQESGGVPAALSRFAPAGSFAASNRLEYLSYNWALNDSGSAGDAYSKTDFYMDYVRNGYLRSDVEAWFWGLGKRYEVNPLIFGSIYVGAIPFFSLSIAWLVRSLRRGESGVAPLLCAAFFFASAYFYLLVAGKNIPAWVYALIAGMIALGGWSTVRKVRRQLSQKAA